MCGTARPAPIKKPRTPKNAYVIIGQYGVVDTVFNKRVAEGRVKRGFGLRYVTFTKKAA